MKKILVPTDFSDCAKSAENYALEIAKKAQAEIHFLHLMMTPVDWVKLPLEKEKFYPETRAQIGQARTELEKLTKNAEKIGLMVKEFLLFDKGHDAFEHHIKLHQYDLIVMGSHGAKGWKEVVGTNTQRVVRYSHAPVLVVKNNDKQPKVKNIVFAANFEEDVRQPFQKVLDFAELMQAKIHLLYVNLPYDFKETEEVEALMKSFIYHCPKGICTFNIYNAFNEERGIQKFADAIKADMIAMTTHGKKGFMKLISPSITESLVNHSDVPVLSVNIHAK